MKDTELNLRELDAFIAEHVMGYRIRKSKSSIRFEEIEMPLSDGSTKWCGLNLIEKYTTDPAAAMEVLGACSKKLYSEGQEQTVSVGYDEPYWVIEKTNTVESLRTEGASRELQICLFAKAIFTKHP